MSHIPDVVVDDNDGVSYVDQSTIEMLEKYINYQNQRFNDVETKVQHYGSVGGILLAIVGSFAFSKTDFSLFESIALAGLLIATAWVMWFTFYILRQRDWKPILDANKVDNLLNDRKKHTAQSFLSSMYLTHRNVIVENEKVLAEKERLVPKVKWGVVAELVCTAALIALHVFF